MTAKDFVDKAIALGIPLEEREPGKFYISNYFFGKYSPECELYLEEEDFNIRDPKGFWVQIKEPAEIITQNYYEHYLPQLDTGSKVDVPSLWEDLYLLVGLTSKNEEFENARRRTLLRKIEIHFGNETGLKDLTFWEEVAKEFPECLYTGPAYRAVMAGPEELNEKTLAKAGYSWALSLEGIKEFIFHGDTYPKEDYGFHLVKGTIQGISLVHIQKFYPDLFNENIKGSLFKEEEIISLELFSVDKKAFLKAKDLSLDFKF